MSTRLFTPYQGHVRHKVDKALMIEAGLNVLYRSFTRGKSAYAEIVDKTDSSDAIFAFDQTAKRRMLVLLKTATETSSDCWEEEKPKTFALERRNALWEENDLERDGLLYILRKYNKSMHLQRFT